MVLFISDGAMKYTDIVMLVALAAAKPWGKLMRISKQLDRILACHTFKSFRAHLETRAPHLLRWATVWPQ